MQPTLLHQIQSAFAKALEVYFPSASLVDELEITASSHAHYQCNSPMKWAKLLGRSPRDIAHHLKEILEESAKALFARIEVAGPGFCNLWIRPEHLARFLLSELWNAAQGAPLRQERILIDFSSPNIAKEMHVGHLRSTIIGDCLARIFSYLGAEVLRINHLGDWGTQFGMLIAHLKDHPQGDEPDLTGLMVAYRASKERFDQDGDFKARALQEVRALQGGDLESLRVWQQLVTISTKAFGEIYELLDVELTARGESHYNPYLVPMVSDLQERGQIAISEGAKCLFLEGFDVPLMVQKSDGGFSYDATDLAALRYRVDRDGVDRIIYVTDSGQSLHFRLLFAAAKKVGYLPGHVRVDHVPFGLVLASDGKKFRTRSGDVVKLKTLLEEAICRARALIDERRKALDNTELDDLARALGISAVKFADLATDRRADYTFSPERMLRFEGNTAPFLLYALVRAKSIDRRLKDLPALQPALELEHTSEVHLALALARFPEILEATIRDLLPHRLAHHLYQIACAFNAFFRDCPVIESPKRASRAHLTRLTKRVLQTGIELLGLTPVDQM